MREELRHAWDQTKRPGTVELIGATVSGVVAAVVDQGAAIRGWHALAVGIATGISLWLLRFVGHLWLAPKELATADRRVVEDAYEKRVAETNTLRREVDGYRLLVQTDATSKIEAIKPVIQEGEDLLVRRIRNEPELNGWILEVHDWEQSYGGLRPVVSEPEWEALRFFAFEQKDFGGAFNALHNTRLNGLAQMVAALKSLLVSLRQALGTVVPHVEVPSETAKLWLVVTEQTKRLARIEAELAPAVASIAFSQTVTLTPAVANAVANPIQPSSIPSAESFGAPTVGDRASPDYVATLEARIRFLEQRISKAHEIVELKGAAVLPSLRAMGNLTVGKPLEAQAKLGIQATGDLTSSTPTPEPSAPRTEAPHPPESAS